MISALFVSMALMPSAAPTWDPAKTWALVIGTLEWDDSESFASFPKKDRRDALLVEALKKRGVPARQITYLQDREATASRISSAVAGIGPKARSDETILVYYCGHGYMEGDKYCVAGYDAGVRGAKTTGQSILDDLNRGFTGKSVWLMADCCFSGQFAKMAKKMPALPITVMASASPTIVSTGNWTFSDVIVDSINGMSYVDVNRDGKIIVKEIIETIRKDMKFAEQQESENIVHLSFPNATIVAEAAKASSVRVGQRVVVKWEGQNYKARIIEEKGGKFLVRWFGYDADEESWIPESDIVSVWKG